MDKGTHGSPLSLFNIAQSIPGIGNVRDDVVIPTSANSVGDTVYYLVSNPFDPRVLVNNLSGTPVYTGTEFGFDYYALAHDYLYRIIFDVFKYRNEPSAGIMTAIIDNIADIGRMLGILMTAYAMKQSRDPEMFRRARILGLHDSIPEMTASLSLLPLPRAVTAMITKYIGLGDIANDPTVYQNIGFLVNGNYDAFVTLAANLVSTNERRLALNFMRRMYPELGVIGDPGPRTGSEMLELFTNAHLKGGDGTFANWVTVQGSGPEARMMASAGLFHSVVEPGSTLVQRVYTLTGWAVPGTGYNTTSRPFGTVRTWFPSLCRWKFLSSTDGIDAAITRATTQAYTAAGLTETVSDVDLVANIGHEYNMMRIGTTPASNVLTWAPASGLETSSSSFTLEDTRYRVSAGFSLGSISYALDGNLMSGLYAMLV